MNQAKFTPGPWVEGMDSDWSVDTDGGNTFIHIGPADGDPVAIAVVADSWGMDDELDANANLIAAAPDLYEALEAAANSSGFQYMFSDTRDKINAALSKARGEHK